MNEQEYLRLGRELQQLSKTIPLQWGKVQNNRTDAKLNMFSISDKDSLEKAIRPLAESDQVYFRRRWFLWQCSRVDEYLFYRANNVIQNPNSRDQEWDVEFNGNPQFRFDVKGTVVPKSLRNDFTPDKEAEIVNFYYTKQSTGVRFNLQNRLFIVHHSYRKPERSMYLRCHWELKERAYAFFAKSISEKMTFVPYKNVISKCIFILESESNEFSFKIN